MPADRLHLVRHGEVYNPDRVLYGRLPGFSLSDAGQRMAEEAAAYLRSLDRPVTALAASPLERTRQSAAPIAELFALETVVDERVIEPTNAFEGRRMRQALVNPLNWRYLRDPDRPSWGEAYAEVWRRMNDALLDAWHQSEDGDVVIVSHQLPIWVVHLAVAGDPFRHDPRRRRCALSSVTSLERRSGRWVEVSYAEPAQVGDATDVGAV